MASNATTSRPYPTGALGRVHRFPDFLMDANGRTASEQLLREDHS